VGKSESISISGARTETVGKSETITITGARTVDVGKAEIKGTQALVAISYKLPSSFGGEYTVQEVLPLNIDPATNTWKIDFTGDSYGMQKDEAIAASKSVPPQGKSEIPSKGK